MLPVSAFAATWVQGWVVGVADGDTITILTKAKTQHRIRLAEIDAPESSMPYGRAAKKFLSDAIYRQTVSVHSQGIDRYGRLLGVVYQNKQNINMLMVSNGYAWAYRQYLTDLAYCRAEAIARKARRGLWAEPDPIPPWQWRMARRINPQLRPGAVRASAAPCGIRAR